MQRLGAVRRWLGVVAVAAVTISLPAVVSGRPASVAGESAPALLASARGSTGVAYEGYVESTGSLGLPAIGWLKDTATLLGRTSRLRVWWGDLTHYRVDLLSPAGERDTYREGGVIVQWDSDRRRVTTTTADDGPRTPVAADLTPPELARRLLAPAGRSELSTGPTGRVAGRPARRLDVRVADRRVLAGRISVWVDVATGLPLRVAVVPRGQHHEVLSSGFLQVRIGRPAAARLQFVPPPDADHQVSSLPTITDLAERLPRSWLPDRLGDLVRRDDLRGAEAYPGLHSSAVATYGNGYALVAVMPVDAYDARMLVDRYASPLHPVQHRYYGDEITLGTPLVSALLLSGSLRGFALVGTVSSGQLDRFARTVVEARP
ncbi:MAG: hypothetical protein ACJ74O_20155 [Frankiaceae bacterium]